MQREIALSETRGLRDREDRHARRLVQETFDAIEARGLIERERTSGWMPGQSETRASTASFRRMRQRCRCMSSSMPVMDEAENRYTTTVCLDIHDFRSQTNDAEVSSRYPRRVATAHRDASAAALAD